MDRKKTVRMLEYVVDGFKSIQPHKLEIPTNCKEESCYVLAGTLEIYHLKPYQPVCRLSLLLMATFADSDEEEEDEHQER